MPDKKCKSCGYHKNKPSAEMCNLCGAPLGADGDGPPTDVRVNKGASKAIDQAVDDRAKKEQIVYAGDFAIVYCFAPVQGSLIILQPGEVFTFGRGDSCDHRIDGKAVSRRHARVHWAGVDPPTPELVDLDSKNGVTVNGVPVQRKVLEDGDEVAIGPFVATLRVLSANDSLSKQVSGVDRLSATMVSSRRLGGEVKLVPPGWLLSHCERIKESGTLSVHHGDQKGYVTLISGVTIAAGWNEDVTGADAVRAVVRLKEGRFVFSPRADVTPQSITVPLAEILAQEGFLSGSSVTPQATQRPRGASMNMGPPPKGAPRPGGAAPGKRPGPPPKPTRPGGPAR